MMTISNNDIKSVNGSSSSNITGRTTESQCDENIYADTNDATTGMNTKSVMSENMNVETTNSNDDGGDHDAAMSVNQSPAATNTMTLVELEGTNSEIDDVANVVDVATTTSDNLPSTKDTAIPNVSIHQNDGITESKDNNDPIETATFKTSLKTNNDQSSSLQSLRANTTCENDNRPTCPIDKQTTSVAIQKKAKASIPDSPKRRSTRKRKQVEILNYPCQVQKHNKHNKHNNSWAERLDQLSTYFQENGNCDVDKMPKEDPLRNWLLYQHKKFKNEKLSDLKINELKAYGVNFQDDPVHAIENVQENATSSTVTNNDTQNNHNRVSNMDTSNHVEQTFQTDHENKGKKHVDYKEIRNEKWHATFKKLERYQSLHGHCKVTVKEDHFLYKWIGNQRKTYRQRMKGKKSSMTDERMAALRSIEFDFGPESKDRNERWRDKLKELKKYKETYGHVNVQTSDNNMLYRFLSGQRRLYNKNMNNEKTSLTQERIDDLKRIGVNLEYSTSKKRSGQNDMKIEERRKLSKRKLEFAQDESQGSSKRPKLRGNERNQIPQKQSEIIASSENFSDSDDDVPINKLGTKSNDSDDDDDDDDVPIIYLKSHSTPKKLQVSVRTIYDDGSHYNLFKPIHEKSFKPFKDLTEAERNDWKEMLKDLKEFKMKTEHCNVEKEHSGLLNAWVLTQHAEFRKRMENEVSTLTDDRYKELISLNFKFEYEFDDPQWQNGFNEFHKFLIINDADWDPSQSQMQLHYWVRTQRQDFTKMINKEQSRLNEDRFKKLDEIGFDFYDDSDYENREISSDENWKLYLNELKLFIKENNLRSCNIVHFAFSSKCLCKWVVYVRHKYRKNELSEEEIQELRGSGFIFSTYKETNSFCQWIKPLLEFKKRNGHCNPRKSYNQYDNSFFKWIAEQRYKYRLLMEGKKERVLTQVALDVLIELDFNFNANIDESKWDEKLEQISKFIAEHKHNNVPNDNNDLKEWVSDQQRLYSLNERGIFTLLSQDRINKLSNAGFNFTPNSHDNNISRGEEECQSVGGGGDTTAPNNNECINRNEENMKVVESTPTLKEHPQLSSVHQGELVWEHGMKDLDEFKKEHGHFDVSSSLSKDKPFVQRASDLQSKCRSNKLPQNRIKEQLQNGFKFEDKNKRDLLWKQHIKDLEEFKQKNGHCHVCHSLTQNRSLVTWTHNIRQGYRTNKLPPQRIDELLQMGFDFNSTRKKTLGIIPLRKSNRKKSQIKYVQSNDFDDDDDGSDFGNTNNNIPLDHQDQRQGEETPHLPTDPLCPPSPPPDCPSTRFCNWTYDEESRVLLAKFEIIDGDVTITKEDKTFLFKMMERTDITVISENLAHGLNEKYWNLNYMKNFAGNEYHHKIRQFDKIDQSNNDNHSLFYEADGFISMKVSEYFSYLEKRAKSKCDDDTFSYIPFNKTYETIIKPKKTGLYMIDFDMVKLLPRCYDNLLETFKLPSILPGGENCMMNAVNASGRPFMGPNLYITPPAAFTHFHQDGYGTVDSGHLCLSGFNEVVMLRRLPEEHKRKALEILSSKSYHSHQQYDALYGLPHSDGTKPPWPDREVIKELKRMNYCPSVFILKPGQCVHINKGRLHAFRKMSTCKLPEHDCHFESRNKVISDEKLTNDVTCVSVAWDWMYRGITIEGIHRELNDTLDCAKKARAKGRQSLAIPETALFRSVRNLVSECSSKDDLFSLASTCKSVEDSPSAHDLLRGIQPSLRSVVERNAKVYNKIKGEKDIRNTSSIIPNSWQNPETFSLDPYGDGDFFCKVCYCELSNVYMHCDGCEKLLGKDFNICTECFQNKKHLVHIQMHPQKAKKHATLNHTGGFVRDRRSRCPCKNGPACEACGFCLGCSCTCHKSFSMNFRFMTMEDELKLLKQAEDILQEKKINFTFNHPGDPYNLLNPSVTKNTHQIHEGNVEKKLISNDVKGSQICKKDDSPEPKESDNGDDMESNQNPLVTKNTNRKITKPTIPDHDLPKQAELLNSNDGLDNSHKSQSGLADRKASNSELYEGQVAISGESVKNNAAVLQYSSCVTQNGHQVQNTGIPLFNLHNSHVVSNMNDKDQSHIQIDAVTSRNDSEAVELLDKVLNQSETQNPKSNDGVIYEGNDRSNNCGINEDDDQSNDYDDQTIRDYDEKNDGSLVMYMEVQI